MQFARQALPLLQRSYWLLIFENLFLRPFLIGLIVEQEQVSEHMTTVVVK
jgi:hypothetical protein